MQDIFPHILTNAKQLTATTKICHKGWQCLNEGLDEGCEIYQQHLLSASCHIFGNNSIQETKPRREMKGRAFRESVHTSASSLQLEPKLVASRLVSPTRTLNLQPQSKGSAIVRHTVMLQSSSNCDRVMHTTDTQSSADMQWYIEDGLSISSHHYHHIPDNTSQTDTTILRSNPHSYTFHTASLPEPSTSSTLIKYLHNVWIHQRAHCHHRQLMPLRRLRHISLQALGITQRT
jgi:hypothetical protein